MEPKKFKADFGGKEIIIEAGQLAQQANGSILVTYGNTTVLATSVMGKHAKDIDYMPLTVDYEEKLYAAGKIKSGRFMKREGRASEDQILTGRMIDRSLRPLFDHRIRNEIQVITTVVSFDKENDPDIPAFLASSLALLISDIPWQGPVAAVRVGKINGQLVLNPSYSEREKSDFDLIVAGHEKKINMLEGGFKQCQENEVIEAIDFAHKEIKKIIDFQKEVAKEIGQEKKSLELKELDKSLEKIINNYLSEKNRLEKAIYEPNKVIRQNNLSVLNQELRDFAKQNQEIKELKIDEEELESQVDQIYEKAIDLTVHENVLKNSKRPDGRKFDEVRPINCQVNFLSRTHGSSIFERGTTQALSVVTLGAPSDAQTIEGLEEKNEKHFFHHYNFPPFCTGEIRSLRGPGRREIGHGALAERALTAIIPEREKFPYTIRVVSEILSSNGSSSMASVSGSSLALMDAGVPIKAAVSGIAMGLMMESEDKYTILTDIQGPEDHHGDMDCKVAGTQNGITACQMDVKVDGVTIEILEKTLAQAKKARLEILEKMNQTISSPRPNLSSYAPRILTLSIPVDKIALVIGSQGKNINKIIETTKVTSIDIDDNGQVFITSPTEDGAQKAFNWIKDMTREPKQGEIFQGKVVKIMEFGAFVEILPNKDGLIHISELAPYRVKRVEDVVKLGDIIEVKVKGVDESGKISLTLKNAK